MPDMYAFQPCSKAPSQSEKNDTNPQYTPNIIPCRVHHDGPVESVERYWTPVADKKDNTQTAHFRGRKLRGRRVALPDGYRGVVATPTDRVLPSQRTDRDAVEDADAEPEEPVKVLETQGTFDEIVVWGHEALPAADDVFVKGVEEWLQFADAMHTTPIPGIGGPKESVAA
ncbi:Ribonuclease H2 subunit C [Penicillium sp. DV-2018c]|nr:Ribonuclease H2 subunit C [Penicillium sp. DV-2018c]